MSKRELGHGDFLLRRDTFRKIAECHILLTRFNDHVRAKDKLRGGAG
jgi:hypothetical protein